MNWNLAGLMLTWTVKNGPHAKGMNTEEYVCCIYLDYERDKYTIIMGFIESCKLD
jgi:hypothetical protein